MDSIVWIDADQICIERSVVDLRERKAVGHDWLPQSLVPIFNYMRCVEQPGHGQPCHSTAMPVCVQDGCPEYALVRSLLCLAHVITSFTCTIKRPLVNNLFHGVPKIPGADQAVPTDWIEGIYEGGNDGFVESRLYA